MGGYKNTMIPQVKLGNTGIRVSRLCFGTGSGGWGGNSNQTRLGFDRLVDLLCYAHARGVTFWDLADQYGSHPHAAAALKRVGRENVVFTTKTTSRTPAEIHQDIDRFRRELDTDTLDIVLLHCLTDPEWVGKLGSVMDALSKAQERGLVRAVGVSCHNFGAFQAAAACDWVEVVLARINHAGLHMDASPEEVIPVLEQMHRRGKGIYGMKVMGCGQLKDDPAKAIQFALNLPCLDAIVLGVESEEEIDQNLDLLRHLDPVPA
jgi:aryl-alcohol dehydrogenase-like predicted oxidoreductase